MAEKILFSLIYKLETRLEKEFKLSKKIQNDIKCIIDELKMITPIIRAADTIEDRDTKLEAWFQKVRDIAFSSENVIDELIYLLACPNNISYWIEKQVARHRIDSDIGLMKLEYQKLSKWGEMYHTLSKETFNADHCLITPNPQEDALFKSEADLVGIDQSKKKLLELLLDQRLNLKVIAVVGMGGVGKSTLVKQVYDDAEVKTLFQRHAWISVSQKVKLEDLLKELIRQLYKEIKKPLPNDLESMNATMLKQKVHDKLLRDKKYEIIVDDVWSIGAWEAIKNAFPECNRGSRVIITTRNADVASASCKSVEPGTIFRLNPLSTDDSLSLLCKIIFPGGSCPEHLLEDSRGILKKCDGLPLAIVAIIGVLMNKDNATNAEWNKINRKLTEMLEDNKELKSIHKILSLSYYDLPYYLKSCFLYMGIFPEDHLIGRRRLIRMWIAEGFVDEEVNAKHTAEDIAKGYLKELLSRNLIQVAARRSDGMVQKYRIHDLLRELIRTKSTEQNFAAVKEENWVSCHENVRRLAVHKQLPNVGQVQNLHHLRSFIMYDVEEPLTPSSIPKLFCKTFKLLLVMDLQGASLEQFPDSITTLYNLRYLSLKDTKVSVIPKSIGYLKRLETLDLKGTLVSRLPAEIQGLSKLRNLLVYRNTLEAAVGFHSKSGFTAPKRLGLLQSLRVLCSIEAGQGNNNVVREVGSLTALRRLGILKLSTDNNTTLCASILKLSNLHALSITSSKSETIDLRNLSAPLTSLRRLYLTGKLESFPTWIPRFEKLVKVFLKSSDLPSDPLESLEQLPNLVHIELLRVYNGEALHFKAGKFRSLKNLGLHELGSLTTVTVERTAMPSLERFILQGCQMLKTLPHGIEYLSKLKLLDFVYMPDELIATMQASPQHPGPEFWKVRHIRDVNFIYQVVDGTIETSRLSYNDDGGNKKQSTHKTDTMQKVTNFLTK